METASNRHNLPGPHPSSDPPHPTLFRGDPKLLSTTLPEHWLPTGFPPCSRELLRSLVPRSLNSRDQKLSTCMTCIILKQACVYRSPHSPPSTLPGRDMENRFPHPGRRKAQGRCLRNLFGPDIMHKCISHLSCEMEYNRGSTNTNPKALQ